MPAVVLPAQIFLITLVEDEVEAVPGFAHGYPVIGAVGVADAVGQSWVVPVGRHTIGQAVTASAGVVPQVQAPAVIAGIWSLVIEQGLVGPGFEQAVSAGISAVGRRVAATAGVAAGKSQRKGQHYATREPFMVRHCQHPLSNCFCWWKIRSGSTSWLREACTRTSLRERIFGA